MRFGMRSKTFYRIPLWITVGLFFLCMTGGSALAMIYSDDTIELTGKLEAKAGILTSASNGNSNGNALGTMPGHQWSAWTLFKERNMGYLQFDHNLQKLTGLDLQYHLVARAVYDGIYDYGPKIWRESYDANKSEFERYNTRWQAALWEAYANLKTGPINIRVGRQNLSWGELLFMRVVDHINPMDNTWGGTGTESLDDRRIPLWMLRVGYSPNTKITIEGFLVPGALDSTTSPVTPWGSPYGAPEPDNVLASAAMSYALSYAYGVPISVTPGFNNAYGYADDLTRDMAHSRSGMKVTFSLGDGQIALSYQNTYLDGTAIRGRLDAVGALSFVYTIENSYPKVNIFGLSGNYVFTDADFIMRADVAHIQGEPIYFLSNFTPAALDPTGQSGNFRYRDMTHFGVSAEKNIWVRAINNTERMSFTFEYYGNYCHNYDNRMIFPIPDPVTGDMPTMKRYEHYLAFNATSSWHRKWDAGLAMLYNPAGSWLVIPSLTYRFNNPLTVTVDYAAVFGGNWVIPFAQDNDRDKLTLLLKYEF